MDSNSKNDTSTPNSYMAFISYRHADNTEQDRQWATWLHQQLEVYDVPPELIGTTNLWGETIPERIYPVFRDEVSLSADADLSTAITSALDKSAFMVVLCSPRATQSRYVNQEILHFKQTGKQDRIMAALLLGEPNASIYESKIEDPENAATLECFPEALQYRLDSEGCLDKSNPTEPIAADFRLPGGGKGLTNPSAYKKNLLEQGKSRKQAERLETLYEEQLANAKLKIIAGILGVSLEQLTVRDKVHQLKLARKKNKQYGIVASVFALLFVSAGIAGTVAWQQYQKANEVLASLSDNLRFMNFELRGVLTDHVPVEERLAVSEQIDAVLAQLDAYGVGTDEDLYQKAVALDQKADLFATSDGAILTDALALYQQALAIEQQLIEQFPDKNHYRQAMSVSYNKIGDIQLRLGDTNAALTAYQQSLTITEQLVAQDAQNTGFQRDLSVSYNNIGDIQLRLGDTEAALEAYQQLLTIAEQLVAQDEQNTGFQRDLSVSYDKIGDIQLRLGDTEAALEAYQQSLTIREKLVAQDAQNTGFQRDVFVSYWKMADVLDTLNQAEQAQAYWQKCLDQLLSMQRNGTLQKNDVRFIEIVKQKLTRY